MEKNLTINKKQPEKALFYVHKTIENGWSRAQFGQPLVAQLQIPENGINTILQPLVAKLETSFVGLVKKQ